MARKPTSKDNPFLRRPKGKRKRKRTKAEAKERLRSLPTIPRRIVPPILRPLVAAPMVAELLIETDPLNRLAAEPGQTEQVSVPQASDSPGQIARRFELGAQRRREQQVRPVRTQETVREMINDPMIILTPDDLDIINDPMIAMDSNGELLRSPFADQFRPDVLLQEKKKRKPSKYGKELGKQLERLKKKHPRTNVTKLMTKAHAATRKALGMPAKRKRRKK